MKLLNGKPFKYDKGTKCWDKQMDENATEIASSVALLALDSKININEAQSVACVASFSTIVQSGVQDALYKFSH